MRGIGQQVRDRRRVLGVGHDMDPVDERTEPEKRQHAEPQFARIRETGRPDGVHMHSGALECGALGLMSGISAIDPADNGIYHAQFFRSLRPSVCYRMP